ncbi:MAG: homocysteine S-methyltransferase family protein [Pseudomonadota bacterium]
MSRYDRLMDRVARGERILIDGAEEQAAIMAEADADLLTLEMMVDLERMTVLLDAAQTSDLPVWVGLSCERETGGTVRLARGGRLADARSVATQKAAPLVTIMHTEVEDVGACLDLVDAHWTGPVGVYAHSARWEGQVGIFDQTVPPDACAEYARSWLTRGVQVIGGGCGLGVDHIKALKPLV